ncbi:hypothetical protein [Aliarcobacter butzleri]|uniref:hypothetical protein n=1 Tax=Aliarcobacter butzleri TaxID=28197 RepID=UPI001917BB12|nr:hypothetical protein [Aliarcobacter butzleri]
MEFNFSGLQGIYNQAISDNEKTLAFQINNGNGRFVFMMFFDDTDDSKDKLFIFLRNTNFLVKLKMYGSHRLGVFDVYINDYIQKKIIEELQLNGNYGNFSFEDFLIELNTQIPEIYNRVARIQTLREIWHDLDNDFRNDLIDESERTILKGIVHLPEDRSPREKTLRKAYNYIDADPNDISELLESLKERNITLSWTDNPDLEISFADALIRIN